MIAPLRFVLSIALSIGLASTAFASSCVDLGNVDGTLAAGYKAAGLPKGVIFSGNFVGPVTWTLATLSNGVQKYALAGVLTGVMGGAAINAITVPLSASMDLGSLDGSTAMAVSGGDTTKEESVPEPSTLALLGTGSLCVLCVTRRRNGTIRN